MVRRHRKSVRKSRRVKRRVCARNGTMRGGSWGFGYRNGEMLSLGYPEHARYESCGGVSRPGMLSTEAAAGLAKGLPGMSGGRRKSRASHRKSRRRTMRGGRYETVFDDAAQLGLGPRGGTLASVNSLGGERGAGTPYPSPTECTGPKMTGGGVGCSKMPVENPTKYKAGDEVYIKSASHNGLRIRGPVTITSVVSSIPPIGYSGIDAEGTLSWIPESKIIDEAMSGGGAQLAAAPFSQEQTAGYKFEPSTYLNSVGAPLDLRTPVGGQMGVPACKQTGGRRRARSVRRRRSARRAHRKH